MEVENHSIEAMQGNSACCARTRAGTPCRNYPTPGRSRCRLHGGRSTGPRTIEGRVRISLAQRRRWSLWRAAQLRQSVGAHAE